MLSGQVRSAAPKNLREDLPHHKVEHITVDSKCDRRRAWQNMRGTPGQSGKKHSTRWARKRDLIAIAQDLRMKHFLRHRRASV